MQKLELINYKEYQKSVPPSGYHILAQQSEDNILVYQAYNNAIADFALKHQHFGGSHFKYSRMSWIKPNFLWMMYRCGWAEKPNQERVLGIWLKKSDFDRILSEAVYSSYQKSIYESQEDWKKCLEEKEVRLQWDPDHDIFGKKEERRAIQLGMKGNILEDYGKQMIVGLIDMTEMVREQKAKIDSGNIATVMLPKEWTYAIKSVDLARKLNID